jgi:hypothetical protein
MVKKESTTQENKRVKQTEGLVRRVLVNNPYPNKRLSDDRAVYAEAYLDSIWHQLYIGNYGQNNSIRSIELSCEIASMCSNPIEILKLIDKSVQRYLTRRHRLNKDRREDFLGLSEAVKDFNLNLLNGRSVADTFRIYVDNYLREIDVEGTSQEVFIPEQVSEEENFTKKISEQAISKENITEEIL